MQLQAGRLRRVSTDPEPVAVTRMLFVKFCQCEFRCNPRMRPGASPKMAGLLAALACSQQQST